MKKVLLWSLVASALALPVYGNSWAASEVGSMDMPQGVLEKAGVGTGDIAMSSVNSVNISNMTNTNPVVANVDNAARTTSEAVNRTTLPIVDNRSTTLPAEGMKKQGASAVEAVVVIPKVFGDGEKVSAVALAYPKAIDTTTLSTDDFAVEGREISRVYTNYHPTTSWKDKGEVGRYVIVELKQENTVPFEQGKKDDKGNMDSPNSQGGDNNQSTQSAPNISNALNTSNTPNTPNTSNTQNAQNTQNTAKGPDEEPGMGLMRSNRVMPSLDVSVEQTGTLKSLDGTVYLTNRVQLKPTARTTDIIDSFKTVYYTDPATGYTIPYNVYLPAGYDGTKSYPLYFFVADASANNSDITTPLYQGNGATIFASEEEQRKHETIIVAPQYTQSLVDQLGMLTTDQNEWTEGLTLVTDLLYHVIDTYAVDKERIYGVGQSQGGMTNIAISDKYPDLFAAQWLVACQWNVEEMKALKDKKLWIIVSEGDDKAYPGMNAATSEWEALGTKVARSDMWDSYSTASEFDTLVKATEAQQAPINYTVFKGGNHMYTWSVAYTIEGIRDWLFSQTRSGKPVSETASGKAMVETAKKQAYRESGRKALEEGIAYKDAGEYKKAEAAFNKAVALGDMKSYRYLGYMYEQGLGVKKDQTKAFHYFLEGAKAGDITSQAHVGQMYVDGTGTIKDYGEALIWFEKAATNDTIIGSDGLVGLAGLYEHGYGVPKDAVKAKEYYVAAAALGNPVAIEWLRYGEVIL
ncbi:hypothetical protein [uncultured Veillonella sp.]|uniref:hypothetical protein n=1 Tax=uncultured Veillonella sp. TaxID=159268 RepID=UPI0025E58C4A|nr:hypothetical protein [uncultured Veillonella sp.]